jgi:enamine deaminase RidA (YjgF/YER057c/UK114 family)
MITPGMHVTQLSPAPPRWVDELFGGSWLEHGERDGDVRIRTSGTFAHATTRIRDAIHLDAASLRVQVGFAYLAMVRALANLDRHPIRFWNFVPGIGESMSPNIDRYMVFNAGRYDAHAELYGPKGISNGNGHSPATASAIGVTGSDLSIHCLATEEPGRHIENPRQRSAWQYSARYGPLPPCFSRATIATFRDRRHLLIGGTASVVGEDSQHAGDLDAQLDETLLNIESLVKAASGDAPDRGLPLDGLVDVRVYITVAKHEEPVTRTLSERCPHARAIDVVVAQICRPELLVEIEGLAEL